MAFDIDSFLDEPVETRQAEPFDADAFLDEPVRMLMSNRSGWHFVFSRHSTSLSNRKLHHGNNN